MRSRAAALAVVPLLLIASCGSDDSASGSVDDVKVSGSVEQEPTITVKDLSVDKADSKILVQGDGPKVDLDGLARVHIKLVSGVDGKKLASTWDSQPTIIGGGTTDPIAGLDESLDGVARGSRVLFVSQVSDALGEDAVTQLGVKTDDAIVAVVDVISVQDPDPLTAPKGKASAPPPQAPAVVEKDGQVTGFDWSGVGAKPEKVQVIPLVEGTGPAIKKGQLVTFDYLGALWKAKKPFDESYSKSPVTFPVGVGGLIPAWDEGLIGVKKGSRVLIIAPPSAGYGDQGKPPTIPPKSTLAFVVDILGVDG